MGSRVGYSPAPGLLQSIVEAAQDCLAALRKWSPCYCGLGEECTCQNCTSLPNFPHEDGNRIIIEKFLALERLINPRLLSLHDPSRRIQVTSWSAEVGLGLAWLVDNEDPRVQTFIGIVRGRTERSSRG